MSRPWAGAVVVVVGWLISAAAYPWLPERIAVHWDFRGEVDRWASASTGAFVTPAMLTGLFVLLLVLPRIDPLRRNYEIFGATYWRIGNLILLSLLALHAVLLGAALGLPVAQDRVVLAAVGLLFVLVGNYLPRLRPNWWMGIRTPWTLSSESVWRATHRLGGRTFVAGGLVALTLAALPTGWAHPVAAAALALAALLPAAWSYVLWRRQVEEPLRQQR